MLKRLTLKVIHSLATTVFTVLEVLGIPRVPNEGGPAQEGGTVPGGSASNGAVEG